MAQTYSGSMEVLLVDDGSPDNSVAVAEQVLAGYEGPIQFRFIRFPENRGLPIARNTGTDEATGEYLMYMDSDDALTPDCIEKLMRPMLQDPTIEMVVGEYEFHSKEGYIPFVKDFHLREEDYNSRARAVEFSHHEAFLMCWNRLIRRDFLVKNDIRFKPGILAEDNLWSFHMAQFLSHVYTIPDVTYLYCIRPNSMLTGTDRDVWSHFRAIVFEEIAKWLDEHGDPFNETWYYANRICARMATYPGSKGFGTAIRMFRRRLRKTHQYSRLLYFNTIIFMTRTQFGGKLLQKGWALIKKVRHHGN